MAYPSPTVKPAGPQAMRSEGSIGMAPARSSRGRGLITILVVVALIAAGVYVIVQNTGFLGQAQSFDGNWQGVFLANGQVYFGKVTKINNDFLTLEDIYYLQVVDLEDSIGQSPEVQTQPERQLQLIKLGGELHGPEDKMLINRDHIVMIEDLKSDSSVVKSINEALSAEQDAE